MIPMAEGERGRPTAFTPEIATKIQGYIIVGAPIYIAAAAAGIARSTLYDWITRGAKGEQPFADFAEMLETAMGQSKMRNIAHVSQAAAANWTAAAWWLERTCPDEFGRRERREITGPGGGPHQHEHTGPGGGAIRIFMPEEDEIDGSGRKTE